MTPAYAMSAGVIADTRQSGFSQLTDVNWSIGRGPRLRDGTTTPSVASLGLEVR